MGSSNSRPVLRAEDRLLLASTSGLRQDQVEERFQAFLREHPDGKLRPRDFRCTMVEAGGSSEIQGQSRKTGPSSVQNLRRQ